MSQEAKSATPQVTQREFEIKASGKAKKKRVPIEVISALLKGIWPLPPLWVWRFFSFMLEKSWNNRAWRKREIKYFALFFIGVAGCWIVQYVMLSLIVQGHPNAVAQFWFTVILSCVVLNPLSHRWQKPSFEKIMETDKQLSLAYAPDAIGISFPIGWTPEKEWVRYGFRRAIDKSDVFPRHLAAFGIDGYGQTAFALNAILSAFQQTEYKFFFRDVVLAFFKLLLFRFEPPQRKIIRGLAPVVIIMNPSDAGINFHDLVEQRGIVLYTTQIDCEKGIWYAWQELKRRRNNGDKTSPRILIVADDNIANAFIGQNTAMKNLAMPIHDLVDNGNHFNINLLIFPKPHLYEGRAKEIHRYRYDCAQFYTEVMREVKLKMGDSFERKVDSPPAYIGLFHWKIRGKVHTVKGIEPNKAQIVYRIQNCDYTNQAFRLYEKFSVFDFPEYQKYERPVEDVKPKFDKEFFEKYGDEMTKPFRKWRRQKFQPRGPVAIGADKTASTDQGPREEFYQLHHAEKSSTNGKNGKQTELEIEKER